MIIDHRLYVIRPHKLAAWLKLWERDALPIQKEMLGTFLGMYLTEVGNLNEVLHLWAYTNMGEREVRRLALLQDPRWQKYLADVTELEAFETPTNRIMRPTAFSPQLIPQYNQGDSNG